MADTKLSALTAVTTLASSDELYINDAGVSKRITVDNLTKTGLTSATSTTDGVVELATDAETITGTDTGRAVTPANVTAVLQAPGKFTGTTKGGDITSASPLVVDTDGDYFDVTGTTNYAAMTVAANRHFFLQFDAVLTMSHDATDLDLPGEANITTAAGDVGEFFSTGTSTVQCVNYTKADGTAIVIGADSITGAKIADDAIDSEHYTDGSIDNAHIADDAIDSEHYAAGSIDTAHLGDLQVTTAKIAADAITSAKIADDAIDSEHYTDGSIDNAHIADDAIDSEHYAAGSIDEAHLADNAVTLAKMAGLARGKFIYGDSSGDPAALAVGSANQILTHDGTDLAWTTGLTGNVSLPDAKSINISTPLLANADHTYTGLSASMLAGGAISAFDLVCVHTTTQEVVEADASAYATARVIGIAPAAISDTATGTILLHGFIRDDTWTWTAGSTLYLSETAGAMTHTAPSTDGAFVQVVGVALSPDVVYINPSMDVIEHA
jgi:hypothetical protein